ncbi:MAG: hypothetical protein IEMM0002_0836 [bacterium]|nr:MAG: hypothetical protein IEMM0002_0836 [bacterium]
MEPKNNVSAGYRVTLIGAFINVALAVIKFVVGTAGNSAAMVADAIHSLSDLATDVVVYLSLKISSREPDADHPYGHGRAETIGASFVGIAILFVGMGISWEIMTRVLGGRLMTPMPIALSGAALSIAVKETIYRYTLRVGKELRSESIIANAWHHRTDAVSSVAVLIGISGTLFGYPLMDPLAAVVVGFMIAHAGGKIAWGAVQNLMDTGVSPEELNEIRGIIKNTPGVIYFHELKTRRLGKDALVDLHIQVPPRISISEAHNISETVRHNLISSIEQVSDALVHIDAEDDRVGRLYKVDRRQVEEIVKKAVDAIPGIETEGEIILHYFCHEVCVDITIKMDGGLTEPKASETVRELKKKLLDNHLVTEVRIRQNLGRWVKPEDESMKGDQHEVPN